MSKLFFLMAGVLTLTGCSVDTKMENICKEFIEYAAIDPQSLVFNKVKITKGQLTIKSINDYFNGTSSGNLSKAKQELKKRRIKHRDESKDIYVSIDYTAKNRMGGATRDKALCRYIEWDKETELISFTLGGKDYTQDDFLEIFLQHERPKNLTSLYRVK